MEGGGGIGPYRIIISEQTNPVSEEKPREPLGRPIDACGSCMLPGRKGRIPAGEVADCDP